MLKSPCKFQTTTIPSPSASPAAESPSSFFSSGPLRRLLDETSDLIDSPPFTKVATLLLDTTFSHLTDHEIRTEAYRLPDPSNMPRVQEVPDLDSSLAKAKLAAILAVMTKQAHAIGNGVPNKYAQAIENVKELDAFAAVIYSSQFEFEALGDARSEQLTEPPVREEGWDEKQGAAVAGAATDMFEGVWGKIMGS